jgi:dTDP-glucose 4,6-dehydratase
MKILVTGGLGFIGSNFIRHLLKARPAWSIVNLDKRTYAGNPANLQEVARNPRYRWVRADICDPEAVEKAMAGCEQVVHFAAETHVDRSILDAGAFLRTNILGTQVLLDAALRQGVTRFLAPSPAASRRRGTTSSPTAPTRPPRRPPTCWCAPISSRTRRRC